MFDWLERWFGLCLCPVCKRWFFAWNTLHTEKNGKTCHVFCAGRIQ